MDSFTTNNSVRICGRAAGPAEYSHSSRSREFYVFPLEVRRLSGSSDTLNVLVGRDMLGALEAAGDGRLCVDGELRSFNSRRAEWPRLVITVFARDLAPCAGEDENTVRLRGALCRPPTLRTTPMGRDICDVMLAVNRRYGRSDYLPCILWGSLAREAALWRVGQRVELSGRIQSRSYLKQTELGEEERTAFEVSVSEAEPCPAAAAVIS